MTGKNDTEIVWSPQPGPQAALIDCPFPEIFYGGARGGGKTDGVLGKYAIKAEIYGSAFNALFFRKELPMLDDAIERSHQIFGALDAEWHEQKKMWRFAGGGRLRFRPLERVQDAEKYQGQNVSDACVEEAGNYPDPKPIDRINGVLRSVAGVPTQLVLTGNPGGPGQNWIKARYIDPAPMGMRALFRTLPNGNVHKYVFIPSKLQNNRALMVNDPDYVNRLYLVGSDELVRAWLDGDWGVVEGAYFDCWSDRLIVRPFEIPKHWTRFRSFDWGSARPFSVGWWAVASEDYNGIPKNAMIRYREWYGCKRDPNGMIEPNTGVKLTVEQVAAGIKAREDGDKIKYGVADPAIFAQDGGPSMAERMMKCGVTWRRADNKRVAGSGSIGGWDQMRQRMQGEDDRPMIYCFSTCTDSIRTIPTLQHDTNKPEDLDTDGEDHCFIAGTKVLTESGQVDIDHYIYAKHGGVWSAGKWRYAWGFITSLSEEVIRIGFDNGVSITCTPDHKFMDISGEWRPAISLLHEEIACDQQSLAGPSRNLTAGAITCAGDIFKEKAKGFIGRFGELITGRSKKDGISTIKMETRPIMRQKILNVLVRMSIYLTGMDKPAESTANARLNPLKRQHQHGMGLPPVESGTASIMTVTSGRLCKPAFLVSAWNVAVNTWLSRLEKSRASIVQTPVKPARCVSVERLGSEPVYCLNVPETQSFTVCGLIVHNCADEWRYACMSRPYTAPKPEPDKPIRGVRDMTLNELFKKTAQKKRGRI